MFPLAYSKYFFIEDIKAVMQDISYQLLKTFLLSDRNQKVTPSHKMQSYEKVVKYVVLGQ